MSIWHLTARWRGALLDTLFPQACLVCRRASGPAPVCATCVATLPRLGGPEAPCCPHCAHPLPAGAEALPCGPCLAAQPAFDAARAPFAYAAPVDALVQQLKFGRRLASADFLGRHLAALAPTLPEAPDRLLPVPLAPRRLAERGFNQAVELARPVARALALRIDYASVQRIRDTPPQSGLSGEARRRNLRDAFATATRFDGEHVVLIDDVLTTGGTLEALAALLKRQGARRVSVLVAARTQRSGG